MPECQVPVIRKNIDMKRHTEISSVCRFHYKLKSE